MPTDEKIAWLIAAIVFGALVYLIIDFIRMARAIDREYKRRD